MLWSSLLPSLLSWVHSFFSARSQTTPWTTYFPETLFSNSLGTYCDFSCLGKATLCFLSSHYVCSPSTCCREKHLYTSCDTTTTK